MFDGPGRNLSFDLLGVSEFLSSPNLALLSILDIYIPLPANGSAIPILWYVLSL